MRQPPRNPKIAEAERRRYYARHEHYVAKAKLYRERHPEKKIEQDRNYYLKHHKERLEYAAKRRAENPEKFKEENRRYREKNKERIAAYQQTPLVRAQRAELRQKWNLDKRLTVLRHYSGSMIPFCAQCHIDDLDVLTVDHLKGNGRKHREEIRACSNSVALYLWIIRQDFPPDFQVLCQNCNTKKYKIEQREAFRKRIEELRGQVQ